MSLGARIVRLTAGNGSAQVLQLVSLPLLSRLFEPGHFGAYVLFVGAAAVLSVFAGLRYEAAIILPRRENSAAALSALVLWLAATTAIAVGAGTLVVTLASESGTARTTALVTGVGLLCVLPASALQRVFAGWLARASRFGAVGMMQFTAVAATLTLQVLLVNAGVPGFAALVAGHVGGQVLAALVFARGLGSAWRRLHLVLLRRRHLVAVAARYARFPKFMLPYGLSSALRERLVHFSVGAFAGSGALGQFAMAARVAGAPNSFLYQGVSPVMYAHAARASRPEVSRDGAAIMELLAMLLVPAFIFLAVDGPRWLDLLLGDSWSGTGRYVSLLAAPYLALALTSWLDRLFDVYRTQDRALLLDVAFTVTLVSTVSIAAARGGGHAAAATFAVVFTAYELVWTAITYRLHGLRLRMLRRPAALVVVLGSASAAVLAGLTAMMDPTPRAVLFFFLAGLSVLGYLRFGGGRHRIRMLFGAPVNTG